jgi:ABC-2 type transport system permease protein
MNVQRTLAITRRLLAQFRHDHRTLAILFVTPLLMLGLFALLLRTDAAAPRVGVIASGDGLGALVGRALSESDAVAAVSYASTSEADAALRAGDLDAYVVVPAAPDAGGVLRPQIVVEGTDARVASAVPLAMQRAVAAAVASFAPPLPPGAGGLPRVEPQVRALYGDGQLDTLDLFGGPFIGLLVFFLVYVVTSVSFLRERSLGTLERLMASPLRRTEIVVGYMLGFLLVALVQAAEVLGFGLVVLNLYNAGPVWLIFVVEVLLALGAVNLGIFLSTFARNEFQAVQFIPLVVVPQILLSGLLVPVSSEPQWMRWISNVLPLTYAVRALQDIMLRGASVASSSVQLDLAVLFGFCVLAVLAAAATLRREVA